MLPQCQNALPPRHCRRRSSSPWSPYLRCPSVPIEPRNGTSLPRCSSTARPRPSPSPPGAAVADRAAAARRPPWYSLLRPSSTQINPLASFSSPPLSSPPPRPPPRPPERRRPLQPPPPLPVRRRRACSGHPEPNRERPKVPLALLVLFPLPSLASGDRHRRELAGQAASPAQLRPGAILKFILIFQGPNYKVLFSFSFVLKNSKLLKSIINYRKIVKKCKLNFSGILVTRSTTFVTYTFHLINIFCFI